MSNYSAGGRTGNIAGRAKKNVIMAPYESRFLMFDQVSVIRKLSSIFSTILSNLAIGTAKEISLPVRHLRAEGSNIPITALCLCVIVSR